MTSRVSPRNQVASYMLLTVPRQDYAFARATSLSLATKRPYQFVSSALRPIHTWKEQTKSPQLHRFIYKGRGRRAGKTIYHKHWERNSAEDNFDDFLFGHVQESFESLPFAIQFEFSVWKGRIVINENAFLPANTNFLRLQRSHTYNTVAVFVYVPWQDRNKLSPCTSYAVLPNLVVKGKTWGSI